MTISPILDAAENLLQEISARNPSAALHETNVLWYARLLREALSGALSQGAPKCNDLAWWTAWFGERGMGDQSDWWAKQVVQDAAAPALSRGPGPEAMRQALEDIASGELGINVAIRAAKKALGAASPAGEEQ